MKWQEPKAKIDAGESVITRLLELRGISDVARYKFPSVDDFTSPEQLFDTLSAAEAIIKAVKAGKKIFIHGDYDVDGVCATALMWDFLYRELGADVLPFIPNRFDDGYGLSANSLDAIVSQGAKLIITVDCGVKDLDRVKEYKAKGIEFIITDHHTLPVNAEGKPEVSSEALAVVHPRFPGHEYPLLDICGTTVAFKLCQVIASQAKLETDMFDYLDLVALATVCDVMPLIGENRALVSAGLQQMQAANRLGIGSLLKVADVARSTLRAYHLGFVLGPRLNAAGRLESAMESLRLLTTQSPEQAQELATKLQNLNTQRQKLTQDLLVQAELQVAEFSKNQKIFFVHGQNWPEGIIGLIAGKLTEKYHRPVLVASEVEGEFVGSARSVGDFHIAGALKQLDHLLTRHGGHALAAGFSFKSENLEEFILQLQELGTQIDDKELEPVLNIDLEIVPELVGLNLAEELQLLEPFGFGNTTPVFLLRNLQIKSRRNFGKQSIHIDWSFLVDGFELKGLQFGAAGDSEVQVGDSVDVAVNIGIDDWNGRRKPKLTIKDIRKI